MAPAAPPTRSSEWRSSRPPARVVPSSGLVTRPASVLPSAARKTPLSAWRRPHRAEMVKLLNNTVPTPGMPTLPLYAA